MQSHSWQQQWKNVSFHLSFTRVHFKRTFLHVRHCERGDNQGTVGILSGNQNHKVLYYDLLVTVLSRTVFLTLELSAKPCSCLPEVTLEHWERAGRSLGLFTLNMAVISIFQNWTILTVQEQTNPVCYPSPFSLLSYAWLSLRWRSGKLWSKDEIKQ